MRNRLLIFLVLSIAACTESSNTTLHPVEEKIPHAGVVADSLTLSETPDSIQKLPENVQVLHHFLSGKEDQLVIQKLDVLTTGEVHISPVDENRILILELGNNRLIEYNRYEDEITVVASTGRGPGDLLFSQELAVHNQRAYVAMQGFLVSVFDCQFKPCEYLKKINTKINNYSVAPEGKEITVLGLPPFGNDEARSQVNNNRLVIHQFDDLGKKLNSFAPVYNTGYPLLQDEMTAGGTVRYFQGKNIYTASFTYFSSIFLYNTNGELINKFKIPDLKQGYYEFTTRDDGWFSGRVLYGDKSQISYTSKIDENWLLIRIREMEGVEFIDLQKGFRGNEWFSYFILNLNNFNYYKIGDDKRFPFGENRTIFLTKTGITINEAGNVYWVRNS